jgi:hypothetical protein
VTHHNSLEQLNALVQEICFGLEVVLSAGGGHVLEQEGVVGLGSDNAGEQIGGDTLVERNIVRGELGQVDIVQGAETDLVLGPVELAEEVTTGGEDGLERAHTEIVMILGRELL